MRRVGNRAPKSRWDSNPQFRTRTVFQTARQSGLRELSKVVRLRGATCMSGNPRLLSAQLT